MTSTAPGRSSLVPRWAGRLGSTRLAPISAPIAIGTFTNRHHRHCRYSVSTPPNSSPSAPPVPAIAPKTANALARSRAWVNVTASRDKAVGASSAAHAPWTARAATSAPKDGAAPPAAEATAKPASPSRNARLRPIVSAIRPPRMTRPPKARVYAVTSHWRCGSEMASARCADGSAMLMTVASSATISCATEMHVRPSQRLLSSAGRGVV